MSGASEIAAERLRAALERLDGIVDWERRDRSAGMERTLEPVRDLLARLGDPQERFRAVHVAGSKGKGSVSALVAAALSAAGLRTGCYASPHVERPNERVRIDGSEVEDALLAEGLERSWEARAAALEAGSAGATATWFDVVTAAAFWIFASRECAWAVVECGLGGRLDSTNALRGEVAVVTGVELEHTAVLGATRRAIAWEKGSILEPGAPLVTGAADPESLAELARLAAERGGRLVRVQAAGPFEERNAALAAAVLEELGRVGVQGAGGRPVGAWLLDAELRERARLPARAEEFELEGVRVLLDGAHVAGSVAELLERLDGTQRVPVVLALGRDKDAVGVLKVLRGRVDTLHCTSSAAGPLLPAGELARIARELGFEARASRDPAEALDRALQGARKGGWVIVLGSFYLAGELRPLIAGRGRPLRRDAC